MLTHFFALVLATISPSSESLPKLYGTVETPGDKLASVVMPGGSHGIWVAEGERLGAFVLKNVSRGKITLAQADGTLVTVFLEGSRAQTVSADTPAPFSRKWINSHANPMLHSPMEISNAIARSWRNLSKEEREALVAFYLNHGWRMVKLESYEGGGLSVEWENIYSEERKQVVRENRARFEAGLSDKQRSLWSELNQSQGRTFIISDLTDAQKQALARKKELSERFLRSLSSAQAAERATIEDFTKGNW